MAKPKTKDSTKGATPKPGPVKTVAVTMAVAKSPTPKPRAGKAASPKPAAAKRRPPPQRASTEHERPDDRLERLWAAIQQVRRGERDSPRTARLLAAGPPKLAQKVVEEAAEVAIEAVTGKREALINESVDLLYNLVALWNGLGIELPAIWAEMDRREAVLGMVEKLPKTEDI